MQASVSTITILLAASLTGCGARAFLDVANDDTHVVGSTSGPGGAGTTSMTSTGIGGASTGTSSTASMGAGGAGGGLFELGTFDKPVELALDADYVYVSVKGSADGAGQVVKVPKGGGAPIVIASDLTKTGHLVVDATNVFFMHRPTDKYALVSLSKAGSTPKILGSWIDTCWLAVDAERLYCGHPMASTYASDILAIDKAKGGSTPLGDYQNLPYQPGNPRGILADETSIYSIADSTLYEMPKSDEIVVQLIKQAVSVTRMAQDATHVYFTVGAGSPIPMGSVSKGGGEITWLGEDTDAAVRPLGAMDTYVYWANEVEGTIKRVPKGGGDTTVVASGQGRPLAMAADASGVYWANLDDGRVMRFVE